MVATRSLGDEGNSSARRYLGSAAGQSPIRRLRCAIRFGQRGGTVVMMSRSHSKAQPSDPAGWSVQLRDVRLRPPPSAVACCTKVGRVDLAREWENGDRPIFPRFSRRKIARACWPASDRTILPTGSAGIWRGYRGWPPSSWPSARFSASQNSLRRRARVRSAQTPVGEAVPTA